MTRERPRPATNANGSTDVTAATGAVVEMKPYSIGTAARLAGIPLETLRIWERRYQLLEPSRTTGGHRLFSQADVEVLKAAKHLVDSGVRIGAVARMSPAEILHAAGADAAGAPNASVLTDNRALLDEIVQAGRALDTARVSSLLDRPRLLVDGLQVVRDLYLPLLAHVGTLWHDGQLPIAVEHFIEKLVTPRIHALLQSTPDAGSGRLALCVCPPDERHEVGLLAAALSLKTNGFSISLLGADVPAADLESAVTKLDPAVVVIGATTPLSPVARQTLPVVLQRAPLLHTPLLIGGAAAHELGALLTRPYQVCASAADAGVVAKRFLLR